MLSIIIGRLKGKTTTTTQAYRYPKDDWAVEQARSHCKEEGGSFEAAKGEKAIEEDSLPEATPEEEQEYLSILEDEEEAGEKSLLQGISEMLSKIARHIFGQKQEEAALRPGRLSITRDKATGRRRWFGIVTNNFYPDSDREAFSRVALEKAIDAIMETGVPLTTPPHIGQQTLRFPDRRAVLDLGHIEIPAAKEIKLPWAVGTADMVGFCGPFVAATGLEDSTPAGKKFFDYLDANPEEDWRMSHRFEYDAAQKSKDGVFLDGVELVRFTALPAGLAANQWTAFLVADAKSSGGENMSVQFDARMRPHLVGIYGEEMVAQLEQQLDAAAEEAKAAGVQEKAAGEAGEAPPEEPKIETPVETGPTLVDVMGKLEEIAGIVQAHGQEIKAMKEEAKAAADKAAEEAAQAGVKRRTFWPAEAPPAVDAEGNKAISEAGVPMRSPMRRE